MTPPGTIQARAAEVVGLSCETADLIERVDAAEAAADKYEAKYRAAKARLQESEASCGHQAAELHHLSQALQTEQATAKSAHEAVETLATRLTDIQVCHLIILCPWEDQNLHVGKISYSYSHCLALQPAPCPKCSLVIFRKCDNHAQSLQNLSSCPLNKPSHTKSVEHVRECWARHHMVGCAVRHAHCSHTLA